MQGELIVMGGAAEGKRIAVSGQQFVIGYDPRSNLPLADQSQTGVQAIIYVSGNRFSLINQSTSGTLVNGASIAQCELQNGDVISFSRDRYRFMFRAKQGVTFPSGLKWLEGIIPDSVISSLDDLWQRPAQRSIIIGCVLIFIATFFPFISYGSAYGGGAMSLPFTYRMMIGLVAAALMGLAKARAYIIHLIFGIIGCMLTLLLAFTSADTVIAQVGPGIAVFLMLVGSIFVTLGGFKGFNELYLKK